MTAREIADIFVNIELRLIASLKRNLKRHKAEEKEYGFNWPAWQAEKMRNIEQFRRQNQAILSEYAPVIDADVEDLMQEEYAQGVAVEAEPDAHNFFGVDRRRVDSLIEDVNNNLHEAESSSLRMMDDVYRQTIYKAEMAASTGSVTMEQAVDLAVKDFLAAGINCIQYRDGRLVNIATYAEMAIRTSSLRSYLRGAADQRAALGIDTVLVSQYGACSDTCLPWQGRVYIDDVWGSFDGEITGTRGKSRNGKWYPLLSVAVEAGLFHPNCRHTLSTWIDGISRMPKPLDAEKVRETAALEQKQRRMEAKTRRLKRMAEGTLEPDKAKEYRRKARAAQAELRAYIADNGDQLRRDYWREKTHGIPVDARAVAMTSESGILDEEEAAAVLSYISGDAYTLNAKLRGGEPLAPHEKKMAEALDSALLKMPVYNGEVIRSLELDNRELLEVARVHAEGESITYRAFTSASVKGDYHDKATVIMRIQSKSGRDIRVFNPDEAEILYPRNSRFTVESVDYENGIWIVKARENTDGSDI